MNAQDIDERLAALPADERTRPPPPFTTIAPIAAALRLVPPSLAPAAAVEARGRALADERRARVAAERSALECRLRHQGLAAALRALDTPCGLLLGPTGIGKTGAALWAKARHGGLWTRARDLGAAETRHRLGEGVPLLIERARAARVLFLDDLGAEDSRDLGVLQDTIDHRYANGRATFVTSGQTPDELSAYLGAPYVRRLLQQHVRRRDSTRWPVLFFDAHEKGGAR